MLILNLVRNHEILKDGLPGQRTSFFVFEVPARANNIWGTTHLLQGVLTFSGPSVAKRVLGIFVFGDLKGRVIDGTWSSVLPRLVLHSGLSSNDRRLRSASPDIVRLIWKKVEVFPFIIIVNIRVFECVP